MSKLEILPQKIAAKKNLILSTRLDYYSVRLRGETLKPKFFARNGLSKPRLEDIQIVASRKYYEPYFVLGGKYSVDYRRGHLYPFEVNHETQRMRIGEAEFKSEQLSSPKFPKILNVSGEELVHYENETYIILDRLMREVRSEKFPLAPLESDLENSGRPDLDLRKAEISLESEIAFLHSRIVKRPSDVSGVVRESFEIKQRIVVYRPIYELAFQNSKNGEVVTALLDGITGELTTERPQRVSEKLVGYFDKNCSFSSPSEGKQFEDRTKSFELGITETSKKLDQDVRPDYLLEKRVPYQKVKLVLGCLSLVVGLLAANYALFGWVTPANSFYFLGEYARYACAYGGFGAIVSGSMMINDFLILRSRGLKNQSAASALEKVEYGEEKVHFVVSEFEEEKESVSQVSSKQKR